MAPKALLLIDFENEWANPESEEYVGDLSDLLQRTNRLIDFCRKNSYKIIFTRHVEAGAKEGEAWNESSRGTGIIPELHKEDPDLVVKKNKISPFFKTELEKYLEGAEEVVICGILTNLCVRSAVQDAYDRDLDVTVIKDCCVTFDKETQEFTFKDLKATREEIKFLDLDEFIV